jgi:hypothetical protein
MVYFDSKTDRLRRTCDEDLINFFADLCEMREEKKSVSEAYKLFIDKCNECLVKGVGEVKTDGKKKGREKEVRWYEGGKDAEITRWKREIRRVGRRLGKTKDKEEYLRLITQKKELRMEVKKRVRDRLKERTEKMMREVEEMRVRDPKELWKKLKEVSKWNMTTKKVGLPHMVLDLNGREVGEEKERMEVGVSDMNDEKFDREFAQKIREEVRRIHKVEETDRKENREREEEREDRWFNTPILLSEVERAINKLKKGKATGIDGVINELFMKGGKRMAYCVWSLFMHVWEEEDIPEEWMRAVVVPIHKKGDKRNPFNYRGISLLSVVGKLFTSVLSNRMMDEFDEEGGIADEQGGFRRGRGCPDQLFVLQETLSSRRNRKTCCCFIDIKKAYDSVFRDGLWFKLHEKGVRGKMWRVINKLYSKVESSVRVDGKQTEWFEVEVGVRQGCVLSPVLFALFVDGLAKRLKERGFGIKINHDDPDALALLMYADDIVLIAETERELQDMIDVVMEYSRRWRFEMNHKKTEVLIFGGKAGTKFYLKDEWGGNKVELEVVNEYTYLGLVMTKGRRWKKYKEKVIRKAKACVAMSWGMGIQVGGLSTLAAVNVWKTLVRPVLEYGAEVLDYGVRREWVEAERIQLRMGRRILGCVSTTANEVVRGELGWMTMKSRRDLLRLGYWGKVMRMREGRWTRRLYEKSREEFVGEGKSNWCKITHSLLCELHLEQVWDSQELGSQEQWQARVWKAVNERDEETWRAGVALNPKLRTYAVLKQAKGLEGYLDGSVNGFGRRILTSLRSGSNALRIETGRYHVPSLRVEDRICWCCGQEVEDEQHFLLSCSLYKEEREQMVQGIAGVTEGRLRLKGLMERQPRLVMKLLIGEGPAFMKEEVSSCVQGFLKSAMLRRMEFLRDAGIQGGGV